MKYTTRLKAMIEAITDIEIDIDANKKQLEYHESNLIDIKGEIVPYHEEQANKYLATINILEIALEYVKGLDIRRIHELEEEDTHKAILYEVEE